MSNNLMPRSLFSPLADYSVWDDLDTSSLASNNVSISEDDKHVYIEAAVPGINPDDIDMSFDKGVLWIHGETEHEENKKYYQKATNAFSYRVAVPGDVDMTKEPEATCDNGVVTVTFTKSMKAQPKKISVKSSGRSAKSKEK